MKRHLLLTLAVSLFAATANARLGWTLDECKRHWGTEMQQKIDPLGRQAACFKVKTPSADPDDYYIAEVFFLDGRVSRVIYTQRQDWGIDGVVLDKVLKDEIPSDLTWLDTGIQTDGMHHWVAGRGPFSEYFAQRTPDFKTVVAPAPTPGQATIV
jgi:hypothetical protein